jgi:hypothetical protein
MILFGVFIALGVAYRRCPGFGAGIKGRVEHL